MKLIRRIISLAFMLYLAISAFSQEEAPGYIPFHSGNLDDPAKLIQGITVVESSFHRYSINGDGNYTENSTFVWYVENGEFVDYDIITGNWSAITYLPISNGEYIEETPAVGTPNSSEVWIRWDDDKAGDIGYIAVYERSSNSCIVDQDLKGYRHEIIGPPEVWFAENYQQECAEQIYTVTLQFSSLDVNSYPYVLSYNYPDINGDEQIGVDTIYVIDLDVNADGNPSDYNYYINFEAILELDATVDEQYTIQISSLHDRYGSTGKIAPLGEVYDQFEALNITILHLPQTNGMQMDTP